MSPIEALRSKTRSLHERLEAHAYVRALLDDSLPVETYGGFLRALLIVHETVERLLLSNPNSEHAELLPDVRARREALERDVEYLGESPIRVDAAALQAELFAQRLRAYAREETPALTGVFYVLEGSALGSKEQLAHLRKREELAGGGLEYLLLGARAAQGFAQFLQRLSESLVNDERLEAAERGARATFEAFQTIFDALLADPDRRIDATNLNGDAGQHAIPEDLREVAAALRAGESTWRKYGYYRVRYGERGMRFTRSDSAWLASLVARETAVVVQEVRWLAKVLAYRGMPRYLLEDHLGVLAGELGKSVPERAKSYEKLLRARDQLRSERQAHLDESSFQSLASELERALPREFERELCNIGVLPVAAVLDEAAGIGKAVSSLESWFASGDRFPASLVAAVQNAFVAAREALLSRRSAETG